MKKLFFLFIVAGILISGIILTAIFGTPNIKENVIPAIIIFSCIAAFCYWHASKQTKQSNEKKHIGASEPRTVQKTASSEIPAAA